jgi:hypothetical protein
MEHFFLGDHTVSKQSTATLDRDRILATFGPGPRPRPTLTVDEVRLALLSGTAASEIDAPRALVEQEWRRIYASAAPISSEDVVNGYYGDKLKRAEDERNLTRAAYRRFLVEGPRRHSAPREFFEAARPLIKAKNEAFHKWSIINEWGAAALLIPSINQPPSDPPEKIFDDVLMQSWWWAKFPQCVGDFVSRVAISLELAGRTDIWVEYRDWLAQTLDRALTFSSRREEAYRDYLATALGGSPSVGGYRELACTREWIAERAAKQEWRGHHRPEEPISVPHWSWWSLIARAIVPEYTDPPRFASGEIMNEMNRRAAGLPPVTKIPVLPFDPDRVAWSTVTMDLYQAVTSPAASMLSRAGFSWSEALCL